jgi:hypothetical protein
MKLLITAEYDTDFKAFEYSFRLGVRDRPGDFDSSGVKLDRIRIWKGNSPDEKAATGLQGGADDKVFRLDRTALNECTSLVTDRKELAAMRHK